MWDALRLDVRHSFRSLRRAPTFSLIVIVTLALAVGATTAVGSLLNGLVLRTLAVPSPEQLVALSALEPRANVSGYFYAIPLRRTAARSDPSHRCRCTPAEESCASRRVPECSRTRGPKPSRRTTSTLSARDCRRDGSSANQTTRSP